MKHHSLAAALTIGVLVAVGTATMLPVLAVGMAASEPPAAACFPTVAPTPAASDDGTPTILGSSTLTVADLRSWWRSSGRNQPRRLRIGVEDLIAIYLAEGSVEGVRGDWAFAQAILETGNFTNSDTAINNYAGIAHYDNARSGSGFASPVIGVRAQIQLLKKYVLGNQAPLAQPNVAPRAGARSNTWGGLTRTWATSPAYWTSLNSVFQSMLRHAGSPSPQPGSPDPTGVTAACAGGELVISGDYALPVERRWYDDNPEWFTRPHHDYPAIDLPVPTGTPLFALTNGVVVATTSSGRRGVGVIFDGDDRARYTYCHGKPGTIAVRPGDRVRAGQYLMQSASTGNSTGPHLHLSIEVDGTKRCPQLFLTGVANGNPQVVHSLPTSGCVS